MSISMKKIIIYIDETLQSNRLRWSIKARGLRIAGQGGATKSAVTGMKAEKKSRRLGISNQPFLVRQA